MLKVTPVRGLHAEWSTRSKWRVLALEHYGWRETGEPRFALVRYRDSQGPTRRVHTISAMPVHKGQHERFGKQADVCKCSYFLQITGSSDMQDIELFSEKYDT